MKPRCLLSTVERLPTINEMQENDVAAGEVDFSHTMEEYLDSIKELCQPTCYPLHGPLRSHRRWMVRKTSTASEGAPNSLRNSRKSFTSWPPADPSDVSFTVSEPLDFDPLLSLRQTLMDMLVSRSLFAGLV